MAIENQYDNLKSDDPEDSGTIRKEIGPLLFLTAIFLNNFIARVILSPLMPTIEKDLGLSHTDAGSFFLFISAGYVIGLLGAGFSAYYITHRRNIILSPALIGLSLLEIVFVPDLWGMRLGLFVMGIGAGIYLPSGIASITGLIKPQYWGVALAVHELAPNFGFLTSPLISELLLTLGGWRMTLLVLSIGSLLLSIAFAAFGRGGTFQGEAPSFSSLRSLLSERAFWIMAALFIIGVGSTLGLFTMLPLFLVSEHHMDRNWANTMISLSRIPGVGMVFLAGWARDRFGSRKTLSLVFLSGGTITILLGLVPSTWVMLFVFMQPWVAGGFFPAGFAALSSISPPGASHVAVSLTLPLSTFIAGGLIPTWIGLMGDAGHFGLGIALFGVFTLMGLILLRFLNINEK